MHQTMTPRIITRTIIKPGALVSLFFSLALIPTVAHAALGDDLKPVVDNERVTVWDVTWTKGKPGPIRKHQYDSVNVFLTGGTIKVTNPDGASNTVTRKRGEAVWIAKGAAFMEEGADTNPAHSVIVELKDHPVPPLENKSGYPNAFPRPHVKKVLDNDRVTVWDYAWTPGEPTPMHFHDKDVVVIYLETGSLKSTTPDGKSVVNDYTPGLIKYNPRDRSHTEELVHGTQHAMMVELK
jgi:quercetin dioxygenase-like cupin family protein